MASSSEGKQRELAKEITDGIMGEMVSFPFPDQHRGHIMKLAPCVWIEDLEQKIVDTLEYNYRSDYKHTCRCTATMYKHPHFLGYMALRSDTTR